MENHNFGAGFGDMSFLGRSPPEIETTKGYVRLSSVMNRNLSYFPTWIAVLSERDVREK